MPMLLFCKKYQERLTVGFGDGDQVVTKLLKQCVYDMTPEERFLALVTRQRWASFARASAR